MYFVTVKFVDFFGNGFGLEAVLSLGGITCDRVVVCVCMGSNNHTITTIEYSYTVSKRLK